MLCASVFNFLSSKLNGRVSCKFERNRSIEAKLPRVSVVQCLKTLKTPFWNFLAWKAICSPKKLPFLMLQRLAPLMGRLWCGFDCHWTHAIKFRSFLVQTLKTPEKPNFWTLFGTKRNILPKRSYSYRCNTFSIYFDGCFVSLSIIGVTQSSSEAF